MRSSVSIIIPTFNQDPDYLRAALMSAKYQTHRCEIIVVDDGSDPRQDGVVEAVLSGYSDDVAEAKYIWQPNAGVAGALNKALSMATGEWIQWLPSDDLFAPNKTAVFLDTLATYPEFRIAYCAFEEGIPTSNRLIPAPTYPTQQALFDALRRHCFINAASVMWHRSVLDDVGTFNEDMVHAQDLEMLLRCSEKYNFLGIADPLLRRRVHPGQMLNTLRDSKEAEKKKKDLEYIKERYGGTHALWLPSSEK